jgi:hypothetical protein
MAEKMAVPLAGKRVGRSGQRWAALSVDDWEPRWVELLAACSVATMVDRRADWKAARLDLCWAAASAARWELAMVARTECWSAAVMADSKAALLAEGSVATTVAHLAAWKAASWA